MTTSEHAILRHVYGLITHKQAALQQTYRVQRLLRLFSFLILAGAILLSEFTNTPDFLCVLFGAVGGVILSVPAYVRVLLANWPHLAPHINEQSVKSRLDLLEQLE